MNRDMADHLGRKAPEAAAHSPTPWKNMETAGSYDYQIVDAAGYPVSSGEYGIFNPDDRALIVRAVNRDHAFDDLVKALEGLSSLMDEADRRFGFEHGTDFAIRVTLAKLAADEALDAAKGAA